MERNAKTYEQTRRKNQSLEEEIDMLNQKLSDCRDQLICKQKTIEQNMEHLNKIKNSRNNDNEDIPDYRDLQRVLENQKNEIEDLKF